MKRFFAAALTAGALALPASALATTTTPTYVSPGQSAASQYTEDVPTASGDMATSHVHHAGTTVGGGSGNNGAGGSGSSGGGASRSNSSGAIPNATLSAMSKSGKTGAAAAAVASSLAPSSSTSPAGNADAKANSATGQVVHTLTGSDAGSGIGILLPVILIGSLVLASGFGVLRLVRPGALS